MTLVLMFSFDDSFKTDIRLTELLETYGFRATFFVVAGKLDSSSAWLSEKDVEWLSQVHEVGSHTLTHPCLTRLSTKDLLREVVQSKLLLENVIGKSVVGFAYPYGVFNGRVKECVRRAGYLYARSMKPYWIGEYGGIGDAYSLKVTLPLYPVKMFGSIYDVLGKLRRVFLRAYLDVLSNDLVDTVFRMVKRGYVDTISVAKAIVSIAYELSSRRGKSLVISLWGHSWELMLDSSLRSSFEDLLTFIASLGKHVKVVTLEELVRGLQNRGVGK